MSNNNFQVGDLIIHHQRDEIAIVVAKRAPLKGEGYLEVITIYDVGEFPCKFTRTERVATVWDHFTEETPVITK
jgi:hypothetical protein